MKSYKLRYEFLRSSDRIRDNKIGEIITIGNILEHLENEYDSTLSYNIFYLEGIFYSNNSDYFIVLHDRGKPLYVFSIDKDNNKIKYEFAYIFNDMDQANRFHGTIKLKELKMKCFLEGALL